MSDVTIVTWVWRGERAYSLEHAATLAATIRRHTVAPFRFIAIADEPRPVDGVEVLETPPGARELAAYKTPEGQRFPSSYRRLWLFSREAAELLGPGSILLTDVDAIATGDWAPLFEHLEGRDFVGWRPRQVWGRVGEARIAGGMWLLRSGALQHVFDNFVASPAAAIRAARAAGFRGSDQAYLSHQLARSAYVWPANAGVYSIRDLLPRNDRGRVIGRRRWDAPPPDARVVHFNGPAQMKPWAPEILNDHPWVADHWRAA